MEPKTILHCDMTSLMTSDLRDERQRRWFWDVSHLVSAYQGLINREEARLYIRYNAEPDDFWWEVMREQGGWLEHASVSHMEVTELLASISSSLDPPFRGFVVWDERVPATSNLASTLAGAENLLPLRYDEEEDSLYQRFMKAKNAAPVVLRLIHEDGSPMFTGKGMIPGTNIPSTQSAKCDAYLWLVEHFLEKGKLNPHTMGYYIDAFWLQCWHVSGPQNHTLTNHDYVISRQGLLFDLNVWEDESPVDDPHQPPGTDLETLKRILRAAYDQFRGNGMIHVAGFTPWAYKYTTFQTQEWNAGGKYDGVPTEWKYAEVLSCFNAYMDADALGYSAMANASFFQHYPLPKRIPQNPGPTKKSLRQAGILDSKGRIQPKSYVAHYVGDYDAAAWLYWNIPRFWKDPSRGQVTLSWAFNPNLCYRFPLGMAWTRQHRTDRDFFIAGDSGAGYLNPGYLSQPRPHSGLPSGWKAWERHCRQLFRQWDIGLTGFVLDGYARGLDEEGLDAYSRFSPNGIVPQKIREQGVHKGMPFLKMAGDLPHGERDAAEVIAQRSRSPLPRFTVYRSILKSPSWYKRVEEETHVLAENRVVFVDMITLLWLVKEYEKNPTLHALDLSHYQSETLLVSKPGQEKGIWPVLWEDGMFEIVDMDGSPCWRISGQGRGHYLYFDTAFDFSRKSDKQVMVKIEYLDQGHASFLLQYDSWDPRAPVEGAYKDAAIQGIRENLGTWKKAEFPLKDPRFAGRQNGGADLRFAAGNEPLLIRSIRVSQ